MLSQVRGIYSAGSLDGQTQPRRIGSRSSTRPFLRVETRAPMKSLELRALRHHRSMALIFSTNPALPTARLSVQIGSRFHSSRAIAPANAASRLRRTSGASSGFLELIVAVCSMPWTRCLVICLTYREQTAPGFGGAITTPRLGRSRGPLVAGYGWM